MSATCKCLVFFFISGNFSFSFVVGYGIVCQCFEIKNYYNIYINMMLQVKFDFRLNFLTYGDFQFSLSSGPNSTKLKKIENQPTLKKINLKLNISTPESIV